MRSTRATSSRAGWWATASGAALISGVLGTKLPGPGTVYVSQDLRFLGPVRVGDTVTATVTARAKRADGRLVEFDCRCVNQHGEAVAAGVAVVRARPSTSACPARSPRRWPSRRTASTRRCSSAAAG